MTEYQSQNFLESIKNMKSVAPQIGDKGKKVHIKQKNIADMERSSVFMSMSGMHVPLIIPAQNKNQYVARPSY